MTLRLDGQLGDFAILHHEDNAAPDPRSPKVLTSGPSSTRSKSVVIRGRAVCQAITLFVLPG